MTFIKIKEHHFSFAYWKNKTTGNYEPDGQMTYRQAINYAQKVWEKKNFAKQGVPKKVEVLDIMNSIAAAKVTAWCGAANCNRGTRGCDTYVCNIGANCCVGKSILITKS